MREEFKQKLAQDNTLEIERIKKTLDMLDDRLDNMDSVISAVVERMTKHFIAFNLTCPHCGKAIEINLSGTEKVKR